MKRVSFRYCGCCNPQIDLQTLLQDAVQRIEDREGACEFVPCGQEAEICLLLNCCPVGCAQGDGSCRARIERAVIRGWKPNGQPDWTWEKGDPQTC